MSSIQRLISAAAIHNELLHWTAALSTDHPLRDPTSGPGQDQAVAVVWGMKLMKILIESAHESQLLHTILPLLELGQALKNCVPLGLGNLSPSADHSPPLVAPIKTQHRHDLLHNGVVLSGLSVLALGVPHAFQPDPEEPDESLVWQYVAEFFVLYDDGVLTNFFLRVAFSQVQHLQLDLGRFCYCIHGGCKPSDPLHVLPSIQANILPICDLKIAK